MNRMIHTSEPQTSFSKNSQTQQLQQQHHPQNFALSLKQELPQHLQQNQQLQQDGNGGVASMVLTKFNQIFTNAYQQDPQVAFDSNMILNHQKFDFLQGNVGVVGGTSQNMMNSNGNGLLGGQSQQSSATKGKKKKAAGTGGTGRRTALDANGMPKERPFVCPRSDCMKRFCRNDHLQRHMRIHTGQRLFQCRTCLRSFSRSDHLAKHEKTHSADKPFSCMTCARRFHKMEEKKKHEDKCTHKMQPNQQDQNTLNLNQQQHQQMVYQPQMLLNAQMQLPTSAAAMMLPTSSHQFKPTNQSPLEISSLIGQSR